MYPIVQIINQDTGVLVHIVSNFTHMISTIYTDPKMKMSHSLWLSISIVSIHFYVRFRHDYHNCEEQLCNRFPNSRSIHTSKPKILVPFFACALGQYCLQHL